MILNNAPLNEAVLSNVGTSGEFRIKQSAKAFSILSSSLYSNKIKAIIRELSCNAYDSHVAAGKGKVPFDVHLPNMIDGWFSVRDYGTGLSHDDVMDIYTTYFESTKTGSNEYVGALGLGSKSPFAYTDNFTVTSIKDGQKRIYTAFISDQGTPAIALMDTSYSEESNGIEVRFAVTNAKDISNFYLNAKEVFKYFETVPVITGTKVDIPERRHSKKNVIPGIDILESEYGGSNAIVIMGNIPYPIDVGIMKNSMDEGLLYLLTNSNLEINIPIGGVEFQPSREGLSYVKSTISAIETKLIELNDKLYGSLKSELDVIDNKWKKAVAILKYPRIYSSNLQRYCNETSFTMVGFSGGSPRLVPFKIKEKTFDEKYNLQIRGFFHNRDETNSNSKPSTVWDSVENKYIKEWRIYPKIDDVLFIINDRKIGAVAGAKHHALKSKFYGNVYVIDVSDREKTALYDAFLKYIGNPPNVIFASKMILKERQEAVAGINFLNFVRNNSNRRRDEFKWDEYDNQEITPFLDAEMVVYVKLKGYEVMDLPNVNLYNLKEFLEQDIKKPELFGVRKGGLKLIENQENWIEAKDYISSRTSSITDKQILELALTGLRNQTDLKILRNHKLYENFPKDLTIFTEHSTVLNQYSRDAQRIYSLRNLVEICDENIFKKIIKIENDLRAKLDKYPLLSWIDGAPTEKINNYFKLINKE